MDEDAFLAAVTPHLEVTALLAARLAPQAAPGAVVRDAWALARQHWSSFDPQRASRRSWLVAITADRAVAARPRRSRAAAPARSPSGGDDRTALDVVLDALPERQRFAVDCVHFVGLSVEETAELLRVPERSVRSALTDAHRRIRGAVEIAGEPDGDQILTSAGSAWRAEFRKAPLPELTTPPAAQDMSPGPDGDEQFSGVPAEVPGAPESATGSAEPTAESAPASGPPGKRPWLLPTVIGVLLVLVVGTLAVVRAVKAAEIATLEQQDRDLQLCGQVPPGLDGVTVSRVSRLSERDFAVRVVARQRMSVYAAQVTGVDPAGRIATYRKRDVVTQTGAVIAVVIGPDEDMGTRSSVAQDRCDGGTTPAAGLTDHLIVYAFADSRLLVMDAGPVDELDVTGY